MYRICHDDIDRTPLCWHVDISWAVSRCVWCPQWPGTPPSPAPPPPSAPPWSGRGSPLRPWPGTFLSLGSLSKLLILVHCFQSWITGLELDGQYVFISWPYLKHVIDIKWIGNLIEVSLKIFILKESKTSPSHDEHHHLLLEEKSQSSQSWNQMYSKITELIKLHLFLVIDE